MFILIVSVIILVISFILALRSLKELSIPHEVQRIIHRRRTSGVIIFLKEKIIHYVN
ncbi:hypothetical protein HYW54_05355 [Candidatus Gottesmanbacteria bacterium]|nr:hypothetical protein [Candidatus Gottesmanbacteria bacterium]